METEEQLAITYNTANVGVAVTIPSAAIVAHRRIHLYMG